MPPFPRLLLAAAGLLWPSWTSAGILTRCPKDTEVVKTADAGTPWACALKDMRHKDGRNCPKGYQPVTTTDTLQPFRCALSEVQLKQPRGICPAGHLVIPTSDPGKKYDCEKMQKGFNSGPGCPRGTVPVPTPGALRTFRCVRKEKASEIAPSADADFGPDAKPRRKKDSPGKPGKKGCPAGTKSIHTEDPFDPIACVQSVPGTPQAVRSKRFKIKGELTFLYPDSWSLTDDWKDKDIPTLYLVADSGHRGTPVSLSISRYRRGTPGYKTMEEMISQEKEFHGAKLEGRGKVSELPSILLSVPKQSRTAFVETEDGYFTLSFSSPPPIYEIYVPVYEKLLKSFEVYTKEKQ